MINKTRTLGVLFVAISILLSGCGTLTDDGLIFHTADPNFKILVPLLEDPSLPQVDPEIVPGDEVGEIVPDPTPVPPCVIIKGNISRSGDRIYHVPGSANYGQVKIDESAGEMFFCSVEEAEEAGWRKPR